MTLSQEGSLPEPVHTMDTRGQASHIVLTQMTRKQGALQKTLKIILKKELTGNREGRPHRTKCPLGRNDIVEQQKVNDVSDCDATSGRESNIRCSQMKFFCFFVFLDSQVHCGKCARAASYRAERPSHLIIISISHKLHMQVQ